MHFYIIYNTFLYQVGGSGVQGQPQLYSKFEASLGDTHTQKKSIKRKMQQDLIRLLVFPCFLEWTRESWVMRTHTAGALESIPPGWVCSAAARVGRCGHIQGQRRSSMDSERQPPSKSPLRLPRAGLLGLGAV